MRLVGALPQPNYEDMRIHISISSSSTAPPTLAGSSFNTAGGLVLVSMRLP